MATNQYISYSSRNGGGGSSGVSSINSLTGAVTLAAGSGITITPSGNTLTIASTGGGSGTVTSVSVVTANGVSGTVATATTTPAITLTLGAITPSSIVASGSISGANLSGTNTGDVTLGTANGLSLSSQVLSLGLSSTSTTGALSSTDWNTFNGKQAAGSYITALTGDGSASGPGSAAFTLATVNASPGSFGSASTSLSATVNAKGLVTSLASNPIQIVESQVTNLVSDLASKQSTTLPVNDILVGNASNVATAVAMSGDVAIVASGATTIQPGVVTASKLATVTDGITLDQSGAGATLEIKTNGVSNAQLAQMATHTVKGNASGSTANAADLTGGQVTALLSNVVGDSGAGGTAGIVPAPPTASFAAGDFLAANGAWTYVDQSKPRYPDFSYINETTLAVTNAKLNNAIYYSVAGGKQYAVAIGAAAATLAIYDVTDVTNPILCSYMTTLAGAYNASAATIAGVPYVFVASSGASRIYVINVSNPYSPTITGQLNITGSPGSIYGCAYYGGYLYCATQSAGLTVVDVGGGASGGTLTAPVQAFQEGGGVKSFGVAVATISGTPYVFTTQYITSVFGTRQIKSWSISTPQTPSLLQSLQVTSVGEVLGVTVSGNTAFVTVTTGVNAVDLIDVTTPSSMSNLSQITPSNTLAAACVGVANGNYLYIPSGGNSSYGGSIDVYDISTRTAPIKISTVTTPTTDATSSFGGIALANGYIYAGDYGVAPGSTGGLAIFSQMNNQAVAGNILASTATLQSLTPNTALISSSSDAIVSSITTATELSYVHGATSNIQTQLNALSAGTYKVDNFTLSSGDITNQFVTLSVAPASPAKTVLQVVGGVVQSYGTDFSISGSTLTFLGDLASGGNAALVSGDKLIVQYE